FEKTGLKEFDVQNLHRLAVLCPEVTAKQAMRRLNLAWERIYECARMNSALELFAISLFPLVTNEKIGQQYKLEAAALLTRLVESVNPNEDTQCYLQLLCIQSVLILNVPLDQ